MDSDPEPPPPKSSDDIVVFIIRRGTKCAECGEALAKGRWLRLENERPLCLACADLDHLEYLPRGDAALTRRATKYSQLRAVVVQWSRTRQRYERQGILVAAAAIQKAEEECLADAEVRDRRRQREAEHRLEIDAAYEQAVAEALPRSSPGVRRTKPGASRRGRAKSTRAALAVLPRRRNSTRGRCGWRLSRTFATSTPATTSCLCATTIASRPAPPCDLTSTACWPAGSPKRP